MTFAYMEQTKQSNKELKKMSYLIIGGLIVLALIIILLIESLA